jgi:hypothetical protein
MHCLDLLWGLQHTAQSCRSVREPRRLSPQEFECAGMFEYLCKGGDGPCSMQLALHSLLASVCHTHQCVCVCVCVRAPSHLAWRRRRRCRRGAGWSAVARAMA